MSIDQFITLDDRRKQIKRQTKRELKNAENVPEQSDCQKQNKFREWFCIFAEIFRLFVALAFSKTYF